MFPFMLLLDTTKASYNGQTYKEINGKGSELIMEPRISDSKIQRTKNINKFHQLKKVNQVYFFVVLNSTHA